MGLAGGILKQSSSQCIFEDESEGVLRKSQRLLIQD